MNEQELNELSNVLATLDQQEVMVAVVNSTMKRELPPLRVIESLAQLMTTLAFVLNDDDKQQCANLLHETATVFENTIASKLN